MSELYLAFTPLSAFLLDGEGKVRAHHKWGSEDPSAIAELLHSLEEGRLPGELEGFLKEKVGGEDRLIVEDDDLARDIRARLGVNVDVKPAHEVFRAFRAGLLEVVGETLGVSEEEYYSKLRDVALALARRKVRKAAEKRDLFIAQAINALDDINKTINLFASRVREWYSLHFPELNDLVEDHEDYLKIVTFIGARSDIDEEKLREIGIDEETAKKIISAAKESMGADITDFDLEAIRQISRIGLELYEARRNLEKYIDEAMLEVAPNVRGLVGPLLGARLIALAGGIKKLAMLPASTIQVLGAEKALFRFLRYGSRPPKHGVIFQYPAIYRSPKWQRGKIARALAAKLAIAARIDAFSGEYKADQLKEELEKRIEEIKKIYAKPPVKKKREERREARPPRERRRGGKRRFKGKGKGKRKR